MKISGFQKNTLIDYPGKVASIIFLPGCNFRCPWCHSPELVVDKNTGEISEKEIFSFLEKRKGMIDGVVICGGEPTIHPDLAELVLKIKEHGYLVKLDTNGSNPESLRDLIDRGLIDYVAMDIKAPLDLEKYQSSSGTKIDLGKIKESIDIIKSSSIDYEFRTTVVPLIHTKEDIEAIAKYLSPAKRFSLQSFRPGESLDPEMNKVKPYPTSFIKEIADNISNFFEEVNIR